MPGRPGTALAVSAGMALALVGGAGAAMAQHDEVFADPDSPAGKEYALPLDAARRDAAGGGGSAAPAGDAPALFGAGISPHGTGKGDGGGRGNGGSTEETSPNERAGGGSEAVGGAEASETVAKAVAQSSDGLSAGWLTVLVALGVVLVGGSVGLSVRVLRGSD